MHSASNHQQFILRWRNCYRLTKGIDFPIQSSLEKGVRWIGPYLMIKNYEYGKKRMTDSADRVLEMNRISLPYQQAGFNFNKIKESQIIYSFQPKECLISTSFHNMEHIVIISGTPVIEGHSIFVPYLKQNHPQVITHKLLQIAIQFASKFKFCKFGYNSQGAASSVNHFHVQMIDLSHILPNNKFRFEEIIGNTLFQREDQVKISFFLLQHACFIKILALKPLVQVKKALVNAMKIIDYLIAESIPHNMIITDSSTIFIVLRGFAFGKYMNGWLEYCGVLIAKTQQQLQNDIWEIDAGFKMLQLHSYNHILQALKQRLDNQEMHH